MKKSLIALAALAATASFAQSSVQLDGILDAGFQAINYKGNTVNGIAGNGSSTSQLNVRGSEDLGGGLKAEFRVETDWNVVSNVANTGAASSYNNGLTGTATQSINSSVGTFGNGEIRVGLAGGFGRVDLGAVNYNTLNTFTLGQPFGTAIGSGFRSFYINDANATSQVRAENAIKYTTPTFNGFNATLYKSNKQTKATTGTVSATTGVVPQPNGFSTSLGAYDQQGTQELGVNYANGPIAASFSQIKQDWAGIQALNSANGAVGSAEYTINTLAAKYTFGNGATVALLNQTNKTDTGSVNNNATTVSGTYTVGAVVLMAQAGELKNSVASTKSKLWGLGADYNLSKRTAAYVRAESIDNAGGAMNAAIVSSVIAGTDTNKFTRTAVGIRHNF
jgi:predicted porin